MNPPRTAQEQVLTSAIRALELERRPAAEVAAMLEQRFVNVRPGEGMAWVERAQAARAAGRVAAGLLPGEDIGQAQPRPLQGETVLVSARAQYGTGSRAQYRIVRVRVPRGATAQEIGDLIDAGAAQVDSPKFDVDPDSYVGAEITHVW